MHFSSAHIFVTELCTCQQQCDFTKLDLFEKCVVLYRTLHMGCFAV